MQPVSRMMSSRSSADRPDSGAPPGPVRVGRRGPGALGRAGAGGGRVDVGRIGQAGDGEYLAGRLVPDAQQPAAAWRSELAVNEERLVPPVRAHHALRLKVCPLGPAWEALSQPLGTLADASRRRKG